MIAVAICIITFRRPRGLAALLDGLAALDAPDDASLHVIVVDNDPDGSAAAVVDAARSSVRWPVTYEVEPRRGIPHARNRTVHLASACDVIAFIDDDEMPEPAWLVQLLRVRAETGADVVTGPVVPAFESPPPAWLGPLFARPRFPDGAPIGYARTSNVLLDVGALPGDGLPFAPDLALTGGSDTHLFMRMVDDGRRIAWADGAVVHETMPASRVNVPWLVRREYRRGNTLSLCLRQLHDTWPARGKRAARIALDALACVALLASAIVRGRAAAVRGLQRGALAAGMATGLVNVRYDEYAVIHGG